MKVKTDFVSNSSSSSFIVNPLKHKTTNDVANRMIKQIFKENKERFDNNGEEFESKVFENLKYIPENSNILIPFSCNYNTFIVKDKKDIKVFSSWNHNWEQCLYIKHSIPEDEASGKDDYENEEYIDVTTLKSSTMKDFEDEQFKEIMKRCNENEV